MDIKTYLAQHKAPARRDLAEAAGTKLIYLRQISRGQRRASADLAIRLEYASAGLITAREVRPDLPWPGESFPATTAVPTPAPSHLEAA